MFRTTSRRSHFIVWLLAICISIAATSFLESRAIAQPPAPENADAANNDPPNADGEPTEEQAESESLGLLIIKSGAVGIAFYAFLGIFSMVALWSFMDRISSLSREKIIPSHFVNALNNLTGRDTSTVNDYRNLAESSPSPIARILNAGVSRSGRAVPEVEKSMEDAAAREIVTLRGSNRPLTVVGNVAPLVGLLGTVVGMIFAFSTASQGLGKGEELANGIYLALLTTALGLAIAIPSMLSAAWFSARVERYMIEIENVLLGTIPFFVQMENHSPNSVIDAERIEDHEREMETVS